MDTEADAKCEFHYKRRHQDYDDNNSQDEEDEITSPRDHTKGVTIHNDDGTVTELKSNPQFKNYQSIFQNLLKVDNINTAYPIICCTITYDSALVITITSKSDSEYYIKMYDLVNFEMVFEEKIGGKPEQYIKCKEIEQNGDGTQYALAYYDDGKFRIRTFGRNQRTEDEIVVEEFDVNTALGIDDHTMVNSGFDDPFINIEFVTDDRLFVNLFHNETITHYHFLYDIQNKRILDEVSTSIKFENSSKQNFPQKCFYNDDRSEFYAFYQEGQCVHVDSKDMNKFRVEKVSNRDLGQMYIFKNKVMIVRSSANVLLFKLEENEYSGNMDWKEYSKLNLKGQLYYVKGNKRFQIVTDEKIYFYLLDPETFEPILENTIYNFMECT